MFREILWTDSLTDHIYPDIQHYYMGFYIHLCPKMKYKVNISHATNLVNLGTPSSHLQLIFNISFQFIIILFTKWNVRNQLFEYFYLGRIKLSRNPIGSLLIIRVIATQPTYDVWHNCYSILYLYFKHFHRSYLPSIPNIVLSCRGVFVKNNFTLAG